jgi:hypothetical protein
MANTINTYAGDGTTNTWTVGFNYLNKPHVKLYIDGVEDETFTWITDSTIAATSVPADGAVVTVQRETPRDALVTSIAVSGTLRGNDVNRIGLQALYVAEEGYDALTSVMNEDLADGKWDAQSKVIKDLGAPTNPNDAARYVDVTTIAGSAAAAAASASAASASASAAATAKTAAELAETNAETAETNAETAETNAEAAQAAAEAARDLALSYRDTASSHKDAAAASASSASTQASNAATSASNASTSASNASTSASTATTQAGIATTQAGLAATAKTAAEAAQAAAEAALDSLDDKYLGSKAADPTLDNDGNALVEGQLYWNSVANDLKIYNGVAWELIGGGGASVTVSDTAPGAPSAGDLWYDSTDGTLQVYYNDGSSSQWVDVAANAGPVVLNEDTMASDSNTAVPSQSSVKTYVDTSIASAVLANAAMWRDANRIVNCRMRFDSENGRVGGTSDDYYFADQWNFRRVITGGTITAKSWEVTGTVAKGLTHYGGVVATSGATFNAASGYGFIQQTLEGFRMANYRWGLSDALDINVGVMLYSSKVGTMGVAIRNAAADRSYVQNISVAIGWNWYTLTFPGCTTGTWPITNVAWGTISFCVFSGTDFQGTAGSWNSANDIATSSQTNFMSTTNDEVAIGLVLMGPGVLPLPTKDYAFLGARDDAIDFDLCGRYWQRSSTNYTTAAFFSGNVTNASIYYANVSFEPKMRITPVVVTLANLGTASFPTTNTLHESSDVGLSIQRTANATGMGYFGTTWIANARM